MHKAKVISNSQLMTQFPSGDPWNELRGGLQTSFPLEIFLEGSKNTNQRVTSINNSQIKDAMQNPYSSLSFLKKAGVEDICEVTKTKPLSSFEDKGRYNIGEMLQQFENPTGRDSRGTFLMMDPKNLDSDRVKRNIANIAVQENVISSGSVTLVGGKDRFFSGPTAQKQLDEKMVDELAELFKLIGVDYGTLVFDTVSGKLVDAHLRYIQGTLDALKRAAMAKHHAWKASVGYKKRK